MVKVPSVLPESTTMISSANAATGCNTSRSRRDELNVNKHTEIRLQKSILQSTTLRKCSPCQKRRARRAKTRAQSASPAPSASSIKYLEYWLPCYALDDGI